MLLGFAARGPEVDAAGVLVDDVAFPDVVGLAAGGWGAADFPATPADGFAGLGDAATVALSVTMGWGAATSGTGTADTGAATVVFVCGSAATGATAVTGPGSAGFTTAGAGDATDATGSGAGPRSAATISLTWRAMIDSTLDELLLTYSPIWLSLARSSLLSIPSSRASSDTRTLATTLLQVRAGCQDHLLFGAHLRVLIECS
jgi:hypothetical protein